MLILNFITILLLFIGLLCTVAPRLYGTVIIGSVASIYAVMIGVDIFQSWLGLSLALCVVVAEVGLRGLRRVVTNHFTVTRIYSVDTTICNLAGIIVADAFLGSLFGMLIWEGVVGKNLFPRMDDIGKILLRLLIVGALRFLCGIIMIIIVIKYIISVN